MSFPGWVSNIGRFKVTRYSWGRTGYAYKGYKPRLVLHTTETISLPGYSSGAAQPHLTIKLSADGRDLTVWQHQPLNVGARALLGISTNTADCIQVEQCMYSDKAIAARVGGVWVGSLSATALATLGEFYRALCAACDIPSVLYPGASRMSQATWLARDGWGITDHAKVPQNSHWDCGALNILGALASAGSDAGSAVAKPPVAKPSRDKTRKPPARPKGLDVDGVLGRLSTKELQRQVGTYADGWIDGQNPAHKGLLKAWPRCRYNAAHSGSACVKALQRKVGCPADGLLGPITNKHVQRWLNRRGEGLVVDGIVGPATAKAIQRALNQGDFK